MSKFERILEDLKKEKKYKKLTYEEIANKAGLNGKQAVYNIMNKKYNYFEKLIKIEQAIKNL